MLENLGSWAGLIVVCVAAVAGLFQVVKGGLSLGKKVDILVAIINRELTHNHGTSMKDDTYGTARSMASLSGRLASVERELSEHLRLSTMATQNAVWATERAADVADAAAHAVHDQGRHKP